MSVLLIRNGTVITASARMDADVLVRDGVIAEVAPSIDTPEDAEVIDAAGHWVMPGGIDTHTHLAHPIGRLGVTTADDFYTGTVAGAFGGVTTILDFGLQDQGGSLIDARDRRLDVIRPDAVIDYGFHLIVTDVNERTLEDIATLAADGFPSFKVYMTYGDKKIADDDLIRILEVTAGNGGLVYAHCENDCAVTHLIERHLAEGKTGPAYHATSRPPAVEAEATNQARERGVAVAAETCPQYLVLDESVYDPGAGCEVAKFVCSPPMRATEHVDALWRALADGSIQQVSSDHAPFRFEGQKTGGCDNFTQIPNGLPGIETRLPILFTEGVLAGRLSPERFVELASTAPARIFGLEGKGGIEEGADADLIVVDPERRIDVQAEVLHSDVDYSPFAGMHLGGFPSWTISRGEVIIAEGALHAEPGRGRLVRRSSITPASLP
jgi:dihydropyrimidinase